MEVRDQIERIDALGTEVLVITFSQGPVAAQWAAHLGLPFTIACDPQRQTYGAYGLERGSFAQIWNLRVLWRYLKLVVSGFKLRAAQQGADLYQLGGDFIINPRGELIYRHISQGPEDRPSVDELLTVLARM